MLPILAVGKTTSDRNPWPFPTFSWFFSLRFDFIATWDPYYWSSASLTLLSCVLMQNENQQSTALQLVSILIRSALSEVDLYGVSRIHHSLWPSWLLFHVPSFDIVWWLSLKSICSWWRIEKGGENNDEEFRVQYQVPNVSSECITLH